MKIKIIQTIRKEIEIELPEKYIKAGGYYDDDEISYEGFDNFIYPLIEENGTLTTIIGENGVIYYDG